MKSQLYFPEMTKEHHIRQIKEFNWPFINKILPQFSDIETESDIEANSYFDNLMARPVIEESIEDPSIFAEWAQARGVAHYFMLSLGLYTVTCAWHATLFEFFHQQLRLFLYKEMIHCFDIKLNTFCTKFNEINEVFSLHNYDIKEISSWRSIDELRLLCNAIKHGDGASLEKLREIAPNKFKIQDDIDLYNLYKTTLLEITLDINKSTLEEYSNSLIQFWQDLPERCFSNEL